MNLRLSYAILLRQYYLITSRKTRLVSLFLWIVVDTIVWGFTTNYLNQMSDHKFNYTTVFLGAVVLWNFFIRVMHGISTGFLEDVWSRNFLNLFSTPISVIEYLLGLVATSVITSIIAMIAMIIVTFLFFSLNLFSLMYIPLIFILFLSGIALGIFGSAIVLRYGPASEWLVWPLPVLLSPFVGIFYPISSLPFFMKFISYFIPPTYVFENLRLITNGQNISWNYVILGIFLSVFYIVLSCKFFTKIYKYAINSGLIARYSAEGA